MTNFEKWKKGLTLKELARIVEMHRICDCCPVELDDAKEDGWVCPVICNSRRSCYDIVIEYGDRDVLKRKLK